VNTDRSVPTARQYLLGHLDEEACSAIEREYFSDEAAVDRIAAAEEDLVEDYLAGRLVADERSRFERHYLASPQHRARLETIRRLHARAGAGRTRAIRYLALAASVLLAAGVLWMAVPRRQPAPAVMVNQPAPAQPAPAARQVFAVALSPIAVRSASDSQSVVLPNGTDVVALQLEGGADLAKAANARAVIQTVAGDEVWRGPADPGTNLPSGVIARLEVPASRLGIDDYIVVLFESDSGGGERERNRYVLRLRGR
jgi:hypothetical protein